MFTWKSINIVGHNKVTICDFELGWFEIRTEFWISQIACLQCPCTPKPKYLLKYFIRKLFFLIRASLMAQMVKNLPAMQETRIQSLGREDPLEEGIATHSSILAWRIPWMEEPGGLQSMGPQRVRHDWATNTFTPAGRPLWLKKPRNEWACAFG